MQARKKNLKLRKLKPHKSLFVLKSHPLVSPVSETWVASVCVKLHGLKLSLVGEGMLLNSGSKRSMEDTIDAGEDRNATETARPTIRSLMQGPEDTTFLPMFYNRKR